MNSQGFDAQNWEKLTVWAGKCATRADVDAGKAIFALGDTHNGEPLEWMLPQPVIWHEEDEAVAAVVVQAESHEAEGGETLEVLGLVLPTGETAVAFSEDVEEVDGVDQDWIDLVAAAHEPAGDDDDDEVGE